MNNYIIHISDTVCAGYGFDYESRHLHLCNTRALAKLLKEQPVLVNAPGTSKALQALDDMSSEQDVALQPTYIPGYFRLVLGFLPSAHFQETAFNAADQTYTVALTVNETVFKTYEFELVVKKEMVSHQARLYAQAGYVVTSSHLTVGGAVIGDARNAPMTVPKGYTLNSGEEAING